MACSIQSDNKKERIRISGLVGGILHMIIKKSYDSVKWLIIDEIFYPFQFYTNYRMQK